MRKALKNGWKRVCSVILSAAMVITMLPAESQAAVTSSSANDDGTFDNPMIYADVPDIDMIRVGDAYYMVSTTMHLSPGCPIMKSTDLVNWEIVNYVYDILGDTDAMNLRNGEDMYGNGQWAASLKYHNDTYYVAFNSNTTGKAYIYSTNDIERGAWTKTTLNGAFHDMSLFFDDDGKAYVLYGGGAIKCAELSEDLKTVNKESEKVLFDVTKDEGETHFTEGLLCEGTHIMKKDGYYYVFNISWPAGKPRTEICHRSKTFPEGDWEGKIILESNFANNGVNAGVAQGAVIDTPDGKWYGFMFQDHGAIGRTPVLTDCTWKDGWPMLGKDGDGKTVEATMSLPVVGSDGKTLVKSDDFYNDAEHRVFEAEQTDTDTAKTYNAEAETPEMEIVELVQNGDFESGDEGWVGFEKGEIEVVSADDGVNNGKVLRVKNRKNSSSSAMYDLTGKLKKGTTYTIKGKMKYMTGPDTKNFTVRFQNGPDYQYRPAAGKIDLQKGVWKEFELTYTAADNGNFAFGTDKNYFFIEDSAYANDTTTAENPEQYGMDYYLDDISITYEKPVGSEENPGGGDEDPSGIELIANGDFETGTAEGWEITPGEKGGKLEAVDTEKAGGQYSLYVSERTGTGTGACYNLSGKMSKGKTYTISGKLKYTEGPATKDFLVSLQHGPNYNYRQNLVTIKGKKGEWVEFSGTYIPRDKSDEFTFDPENVHIFIETGWTAEQDPVNDLMSYYLDDFSVKAPSNNMISDGSFKNGLGEWVSFGKVETLEVAETGYDDNSSLKVSGRTADWQGPSVNFTGRLTPGNTYTISAYVKYDDAEPAQQQFAITMKENVKDGDDKYRQMANVTAKSGEWTKITGTWKMPDDAGDSHEMYFNTPGGATMDFYIDNVVMEEQVKEGEPAEPGEHDYNGSNLDLVWQWNHNPNNNNWSLTEREGWLRLKTGSKAGSLLNARNTLTQRTFGPVCSGMIRMDVSNMKDGDVAGLASLSYNYGYIAAKKTEGTTKLVMVDASGNSKAEKDNPVEKESVDCESNIVYLKEDFNYAGNADGSDKDTVTFYYSFDGKTWNKLGEPMKMSYELVHFMGSKFAIFNYTTVKSGGYVDVDYFKVSDKITGTEQPAGALNAAMTATPEVSGVVGGECEVKLNLDELKAGNHTSLEASVSIPGIMSVDDIVFNTAAIKGQASYKVEGSRLFLTVKGSDVSFAAADKLFATIKLKVNNYAEADKNVEIKADYINIDKGAAEYDVTNCLASVLLKHVNTEAIAKKLGYGNPIFTQAFGADPYAMEYDGRVYVYMTADAYQYDENGKLLDNDFSYINTLRVVSSSDLMNWTDHGEIAVAGPNGAAKWATNSWAPAIAHKTIDGKEKFFLYFANGGSGIGVLEGESPLGPWKDPNGKALLTYGYPECEGVVWCFDPAVLVDDDGSGYIYFGGGVPDGQNLNPQTARVAKLTDDMVQIENRESKMIDAPCMFEDSGIFKYNGKYYYSYCSNFTPANKDGYPGTGTICYMVSDDPMGPFTYAGEIFSNPSVWFGTGGNNHHATFVFEGESYFIYHAQTVSKAEGKDKGYRSTHIDKIEMRADGTIKDIKGTYAGIPQLHEMNPYERIDAETIAWNAGVKVAPCQEPGKLYEDYNTALTDLQDKDWTSVAQLNFGEYGAVGFKVNAASAKGGKIEVRLDSPEGTLAGTVDVPATGGEDTYKLIECELDNITGTKNVFLVFRGSETENIMNVDYYEFAEMPVKDKLAVKIGKAEKLLASLTGSGKDRLQTAVNAAKAVLNQAGATDAQLGEALTKLETAVKEAEKPYIGQMNDKIAEAEKLLAKLSEAEKAKLQTAINEAKAVLAKEDATQEEIEAALAKLAQSVTAAENTIPKEPDNPQTPGKPALNETFTDNSGQTFKVTAYGKDKVVTVTGTNKQLTSVTIPATVTYKNETFKVTAIADSAFANQQGLKSVVIGANITSIGAKAFYNCKNLTKVTFQGASVKTIGKDAFKGVSKKVVFTMKKKAFTYKNLKYQVTKCTASVKQVAVTGASKKLASINIPATVKYNGMTFKVTAVNKKAFRKQTKLKSVTIGKNVKSIGSEAFSGAKKLAKIKFSGTALKTIGKNAFKSIKKNAVFQVKKSKKTYYKKLLKKAKTKNYKMK